MFTKDFMDKLIKELEEYKQYAVNIDPQTAVESCINIIHQSMEKEMEELEI